jgi:uncharacterized protein|tara:strand:+ start:1948 stop:2232 length:285 start_codon:yes stop_codon:yes gene_type:complete
MDFQKIIELISPEIYKNVQSAVEIGKWPNGLKLTQEQLEHSMQILIAYDAAHKSHENRVGYIPLKKKKDLRTTGIIKENGSTRENIEQPIKWQD